MTFCNWQNSQGYTTQLVNPDTNYRFLSAIIYPIGSSVVINVPACQWKILTEETATEGERGTISEL